MSLLRKPGRFVALAALTLALATGVAACGGSDDSDQISSEQAAEGQAVLAVVDDLKEAYRQKDPAAICALLDPQGLKKQFGSIKGCKRRLTAALTQAGAQVSADAFDFDSVTVDGDRATAGFEGTQANEVHFRKVGGKWYVDVNPTGETAATASGGAPAPDAG